jgi:hypothetical protein
MASVGASRPRAWHRRALSHGSQQFKIVFDELPEVRPMGLPAFERLPIQRYVRKSKNLRISFLQAAPPNGTSGSAVVLFLRQK